MGLFSLLAGGPPPVCPSCQNLPARNIFILAPRKGNDNPMLGPDFWNLAGRAGRLLETFNGNIWCIDPRTWETNPLAGEQLHVPRLLR